MLLVDHLGINNVATRPLITEGEEKKRSLNKKMQRNKSLLASTITKPKVSKAQFLQTSSSNLSMNLKNARTTRNSR
jgi:hypothetical protein